MVLSHLFWWVFLPARRSKRGIRYGNVAGWLGVCHTPVLYKNG